MSPPGSSARSSPGDRDWVDLELSAKYLTSSLPNAEILVTSSVIINLLIPIIGRVDKVGNDRAVPVVSHRIRRAS